MITSTLTQRGVPLSGFGLATCFSSLTLVHDDTLTRQFVDVKTKRFKRVIAYTLV
jgi:hypothetical protein